MLKTSRLLYLFALFFAPVAFGTSELWSQTMLEAIVLLALLLVIVQSLVSKQPLAPVQGLLPLSLLLGWILLQVVPLPVALLAHVSPATVEIYQPYFQLAPDAGFISLSLNPDSTLYEFFRISSFVAFYVLTVQLLQDHKYFQQTVWVGLIICLVICLEAILQSLSGSSKIYWFKELVQDGGLFGPFAYRNQFAPYVGMLLPLALALLHYTRPRIYSAKPIRQLMAGFFNQKTSGRYLFLVFTASIMLTALLLSGSRGGIICALCALVVIGSLARRRLRLRVSLPTVTIVLCMTLGGLGVLGLQSLDHRFGRLLTEEGEVVATANGRTVFWKDSMQIVRDFPLTGTGAGTFSTIYPSYREKPGRLVRFVHNDYLETVTEGGLLAGGLSLWFLLVFFQRNHRKVRKRRNKFSLHMYYASLAGIIAVLLHCLVDFHFKMASAVGLSFFFLLGVNAASTFSSVPIKLASAYSDNKTTLYSRPGAIATIVLVLAGSLFFHVGALRVPATYMQINDPHITFTEVEARNAYQEATAAVHNAPLGYLHRVAQAISADHLGNKERALQSYAEALRLNPAHAMTLSRVAWFMDEQGEQQTAEKFFQYAIQRDRAFYAHYVFLAEWLLKQQRPMDGTTSLRQAFERNPHFAYTYLPVAQEEGWTVSDIEQMLPSRVVPHLAYARLLRKTGKTDQAGQAYAQALTFLENEETVQPYFFLQPFYFYLQQKEIDTAIGLMLQALQYLPNEYSLHMALGNVYRKQGMHHKAAGQFQFALSLKPGDEKAMAQLDLLDKPI